MMKEVREFRKVIINVMFIYMMVYINFVLIYVISFLFCCEIEVVIKFLEGLFNKKIVVELFISEWMVKFYCVNIYKKFNINSCIVFIVVCFKMFY